MFIEEAKIKFYGKNMIHLVEMKRRYVSYDIDFTYSACIHFGSIFSIGHCCMFLSFRAHHYIFKAQ